MVDGKTYIQIDKKTRSELRKLRLVERESYDSVLKRLIAKTKKI